MISCHSISSTTEQRLSIPVKCTAKLFLRQRAMDSGEHYDGEEFNWDKLSGTFPYLFLRFINFFALLNAFNITCRNPHAKPPKIYVIPLIIKTYRSLSPHPAPKHSDTFYHIASEFYQFSLPFPPKISNIKTYEHSELAIIFITV